ncbi:citrate lyase holo-[acyl-carrier protein] synthase [Fructobacillus papyrifericola]|uniref:Probable 2-(5''-triphosphoribosyl)-3'-dephosphocoenzyme-A synthase n=1 Tax=Fructobacillus papyrifericola TaxID=2713172 RepID=A0ABS5QSH4_9LACO|nr:citrate lyase holo-[acyl-carrier protein] synthase [Fructobacillus papyrifericola]MBS9336153.1 citrate lyase holo-[acyl-carrier protein] synthase [Fructobacillus papyrifericola]
MSEQVDVFEKGQVVALEQVLDNREWRVAKQAQLEARFPKATVVAVKVNMPGAVKNSATIQQIFQAGWQLFLAELATWEIQQVQVFASRPTGPEGFVVVAGDLADVKKKAIAFEEHFYMGRLFDIDTMAAQSPDYQLSRQDLGFDPRTCLVCEENAKECAKAKRHDLAEIQAAVNKIYNEYFVIDPIIPAWDQETVKKAATFACLAEAVTTPKPGLVDPVSTGAHQDMDVYSFLDSALALEPYFGLCLDAGRHFRGSQLTSLLMAIRPSGRRAEEAMFLATGGVNTHKGTIFTLGILIAAYGYASRNQQSPSLSFVQSVVSQMGKDLLSKELPEKVQGGADRGQGGLTAGEEQYREYQLTGVRGEVAGGFAVLGRVGLKTLRESTGSRNVRLLNTLMALAKSITDSTLIKRAGSPEITAELANWVAHFDDLGGAETEAGLAYLKDLDKDFIERNLSMGGAADYLVLTAFLGRLTGLL